MPLTIRPLNVDEDADIEASLDVEAASGAHDVPDLPRLTLEVHSGRLRNEWPGNITRHWLALRGGTPVGTLSIDLPQRENLNVAPTHLVVHPAHRRSGVGAALYAHAMEFARTEGRSVLQGQYVGPLDPSAPGGTEVGGGTGEFGDTGVVGAARSDAPARFAEAMGAKVALNEVCRRLDLATVDRAPWPALLDDARTSSSGYSIVAWTGPAPEDVVADVARLEGRLMIDAPTGDLIYEPDQVDADRIRATEDIIARRGRRTHHVGARHDETGQLAAWTMITVDTSTAWHAYQQITIVDPAHRGHRLGLFVKLENLSRTLAAEPALTCIDTFNAAENRHMIAINEQIGFQPLDALVLWQHEI